MDDGTDCQGGGGYQVGKSYLVYAVEGASRDVELGGTFWYGWTDVVPEGTGMLFPQLACTPGGEISKVRTALHELGKGARP